MKTILLLITLCASTSALASQRDLKIFKQLIKIGAATEGAMSHVYVGVENIACQETFQTGNTQCHVKDMNGEGKELDLEGRKAEIILAIIESANAPSDSGMGHHWTEAKSISCVQVAAGVVDGNPSAAERTKCTIDIGDEPSADSAQK